MKYHAKIFIFLHHFKYGFPTLVRVTSLFICNLHHEFVDLKDWNLQAYVLQEKGSLLELVDPCLGSNYSKKEAQEMLDLALLCTRPSPSLRPKMSTVVGMLQGQISMTAPPTSNNNNSAISDVVSPKAFQTLSEDCQVMGISADAPCAKTLVTAMSSKEDSKLNISQ